MNTINRWIATILLLGAACHSSWDASGAETPVPNLADAVQRTSRFLVEQNLDEALALASRTLEATRAVAGLDHPSSALALRNLARVDLARGRLPEAEQQLLDAQRVLESHLSDRHGELVDGWILLAEVRAARGAREEAAGLYLKAWTLLESLGKTGEPSSARVLSPLADLLDELGRPDEAEVHRLRALAFLEQAFGPEHPDAIRLRERLDAVARARGESVLPRFVGSHGSPDRLRVRGAEQVPAAAVLRALRRSVDILLAGHPSAPFSTYAQAVSDGVRRGYETAGFRDARVTARLEEKDGTLVVEVEEGPRYLAGGIRVIGLRTIAERNLVHALTHAPQRTRTLLEGMLAKEEPVQPGPAGKYFNYHSWRASVGEGPNAPRPTPVDFLEPTSLGKSSPDWVPGRPVGLGPSAPTLHEKAVRDFLGAQGLILSKVKVEFEVDPGTRVATLVIRVLDEGIRARIGSIDIQGLKRHRPREVLDYLGLAPGQFFGSPVVPDVERILYQSGRFSEQRLTFSPSPKDRTRVDLSLRVKEVPNVPTLSEPLSPRQQTLMAMAARLSNLAAWGEQLSARISIPGQPGRSPRLVYAPERGFHLAIPDRLAVSAEAGGGIAVHDLRKAVAARLPVGGQMQVQGSISLTHQKNDDARNGMEFLFALGLGTGRDTPEDPFVRLDATITPACALGLETRHREAWISTNGVLSLRLEGLELNVEEKTGRLIGARVSEEGREGFAEVTLQKDLLETELAAMARWEAGGAARIDPGASPAAKSVLWADILFTSASALLEAFRLGPAPGSQEAESVRKAASAARLLLDRGVLDGFAETGGASSEPGPGEEAFFIPSRQPAAGAGLRAWITMALAQGAFEAIDGLFEKETWPNRVLREILFTLAGNTRYTRVLLDDFRRTPGSLGPVGCLVVSRCLRAVGYSESAEFAARGLGLLGREDFRKDWSLLFDRDTALSRSLDSVLPILGRCSGEELLTLAALLPDSFAGAFHQIVLDVKTDPGRRSGDVLAPLLDLAWDRFLEARVRDMLGKLAAGTDLDPSAVAATVNGAVIPRKAILASMDAQRSLLARTPGAANVEAGVREAGEE